MNKYIVCNLPISQNDGIRIAVTGEWQGHHNGAFSLSRDNLEQIRTNFDNAKVGAVINLDYRIVYEGTEKTYRWIKEPFFKEGELRAKAEWLGSGLELIKTKKYRYMNPTFLPNTIGQVTAQNIGWTLHSAALTNRPFMEELGGIKASNKQNQKREEPMTPEQQKEMDDLKARVKELENKLKGQNEDLGKEKEKSVETEVNNIIALDKVSATQKETLIALGKVNPDEPKRLLSTITAITVPNNGMYTNSNNDQNDQNKLSDAELNA